MGDTSFLNEIAGAANARSTYQDLLDFTDKQINNWADYILNDIKNAIRAKVNKGEFTIDGEKRTVVGIARSNMDIKIPTEILEKLNADEETKFNACDLAISKKYNNLYFDLKANVNVQTIDYLKDMRLLFFHWKKKERETIAKPCIDGITKKVLLELRDKISKEGIQLTVSCQYRISGNYVSSIAFDGFTELSDEGLKNHPPVKYQIDNDDPREVSVIEALSYIKGGYSKSEKFFYVQIGYKMEF